mgnify:CR=1 FL=1
MRLKCFKSILLLVLLSGFLSTSCGAFKGAKYIDEFIDFVRAIIKRVDPPPTTIPPSTLSDIPEASRVLRKFIQKAAKTSASRTEAATFEFIESGQSKVPRELIWDFAYEVALEELSKVPKKIKNHVRVEHLKDEATKIANQVTNDVEQEVEDEYGETIEIY